MSWILALDDFGGHVHWRTGHRLVRLSSGTAVDKSATLASDNFGSAKIDIFDDAIVVQKDVYFS